MIDARVDNDRVAGNRRLRETPKGARRWFVLGVFTALPFRVSAKHHFAWATQQARTNPAWWNRGLQPA